MIKRPTTYTVQLVGNADFWLHKKPVTGFSLVYLISSQESRIITQKVLEQGLSIVGLLVHLDKSVSLHLKDHAVSHDSNSRAYYKG